MSPMSNLYRDTASRCLLIYNIYGYYRYHLLKLLLLRLRSLTPGHWESGLCKSEDGDALDARIHDPPPTRGYWGVLIGYLSTLRQLNALLDVNFPAPHKNPTIEPTSFNASFPPTSTISETRSTSCPHGFKASRAR